MHIDVSIIVPVYNAEKYLYKCINSLLRQTHEKFEIILVDDGSTDYSSQICDHFALLDNRINVTHEKNKGVSEARNTGIKLAKGTFVTFVDADDWVEDNYLQTILDNMQGVDLLFWGNSQQMEDGTRRAFSPGSHYANEQIDIEEILYNLTFNKCWYEFFGYTWNKCFRNDIIKKNFIRFEPNLSLREDEIFTERYCRFIHSIRTIDDIIYNYRFSYNGLTYKFHPGKEILLLSKCLQSATIGIKFRPMAEHRMQKIFNYMFIATTNMHTKESIPIFYHLYDLYKMQHNILVTKRYKRIFNHPKFLSLLLFLRKRKMLKKEYHGV